MRSSPSQRSRGWAARRIAPLIAPLALLVVPLCAHAVIEPIGYESGQSRTVVELLQTLEKRHYSRHAYDEAFATEHLDNYVSSLDPGKMYFTREDIAEFRSYREQMREELTAGKLDVPYAIFNRFLERLDQRLGDVLETLPERCAAMDFTVDEDYVIDSELRDWARDQAELDERWRKHIKFQALSLRLADQSDEEIVETLSKRYTRQLKRTGQYNAQDVFQVFANALAELYDPHTNYLSPQRSENFNINMSLSLEGIGAVLQLEDDYTKVARLVAAGPADKQGELQPADRIVAVGQGEEGPMEDVIGWRLDEVVKLIRGPKGSTVRLSVIPANATEEMRKTIRIVRNEVKLEEQSAKKDILEIPGGDGETVRLGVIEIPAFYIDFEAMRRGDEDYKSTTRDVRRLLDELEEEKVAGIVIDLRNNGGGSLQEANELTGLFIEYGPTVQIRHASRRVWRDGKRLRGEYYDGPLIVLINRLSASASEIFAGAMQDYQRALIVGDRSFGKGTVQTMLPLTEGQVKVTESKFYRISGDSTQHRGVVPDIVFPSLFDPEEIGESSLDHALGWDQINPVRHRTYGDFEPLIPRLATLFEERSGQDPDFRHLLEQLELARENDGLERISLNEATRRAEREARRERALAIENRRREALGLELLDSLDEDDAEEDTLAQAAPETLDSGEEDPVREAASRVDGAVEPESANPADTSRALAGADAADDEEERPDVLLREAGQILVDSLLIQNPAYAFHEEDPGR